MSRTLRSLAACATLVALLPWIAPPAALAGSAGSGARLEGLLLGLDGRAAVDHRVHLIDADGEDLAQSDVAEDGLYSFAGLPAGHYSLGVELPDGTFTPVAAPPVRLGRDGLARRDVKLLTTLEGDASNEALQANYGLGKWWNGLSTGGKVWTILGVLVAAGLIYEVLDDDETPASPI
jgi:hypothetical protein